jgi:hypothetical protein
MLHFQLILKAQQIALTMILNKLAFDLTFSLYFCGAYSFTHLIFGG